ncbi:hypothetical protein jhhlp_007552 [Lomentospora prolificans]|uniref:Uncharacterized protein n=1 Tax=Lomentospora prolificans TaxID=41688 RepID=A0A2N3MZW7_9PEZI|nr:hypothetical protein jhhlp_007552 [Lomentospora prolificans]
MPCTKSCGGGGCHPTTTQCNGDGKVVDIEDYKAELAFLRARTKTLEAEIAKRTAAPHGEKGLRSAHWFRRTDDHGIRRVYMDRLLNFGMTMGELTLGKPIIGIAQSGSDIAPCNRHHLELAKRVRDGIREGGGIPLEFPMHPIQESLRRPTPTLDRNLLYLALVELLHGYPFDGVVMLTGCDKTAPGCLMAAATVNIPCITLNVGPMLNGYYNGKRAGSGVVHWMTRDEHAAGKISSDQLVDAVADHVVSVGHCNSMGTASTMNALAEALGMQLPGTASIPAAYRERQQAAYRTGVEIVEMVRKDLKPSDIMTREAFENAIVVNSAIGGSTNAPIHLNAIAKHIGVPLDLDDWDRLGHSIPLLLNMQPAGEMLGEEYHRSGNLPAIMAELLAAGKLPHPEALTCNGRTVRDNVQGRFTSDRETIRPFDKPLVPEAGFLHMKGTLFDSAIMKTSVISAEFRKRFLEDPNDPNAFESSVAVFDGRDDFEARLETAPIDDRTILVMRGVGPLGYPGAAEVVNMNPPPRLLKQNVLELPCIGDGRQSGTSGSPSILNACPEAADGGNLALLRDGDKLRIDLTKRRVDILLAEDELKQRRRELEAQGGFKCIPSHTPWQDLFRREVGTLSEGMVMKRAVQFQRVAQNYPVPQDNH